MSENGEKKAQLKNIVVTMVITPGEENLDAQASVSVNGKQLDNVSVGLVLAGDVDLGITSNTRSTLQMRQVARGAVALAEGLREQAIGVLEQVVAELHKPKDEEPAQSGEVLTPAS